MILRLVGFFIVFCALGSPHPSWSREALTDEQKKRIVYETYAGYREDFPAVNDISPKDAMALLDSGQKVVFVDTRKPEEMSVSMLPHAVTKSDRQSEQLLPQGELDRLVAMGGIIPTTAVNMNAFGHTIGIINFATLEGPS